MSESITTRVREQLAALPIDTFVWSRHLAGPTAAVETALSRIAAEQGAPVLRVRKGLYWRTEWTRFGPSRPRPAQIALAIAGPGAGPAGVAAAHSLGLTTQVPGVEHVAVPGRTPRPIRGVRFVSRQYHRRELALRPLEVAVLEALKGGPAIIEVDWPAFVDRMRELVDAGQLRLDVLREAARREYDLATREQFATLDRELTLATA